MNNGKRQKEIPIEVEESSGNVFADLGLPNPEELLAKAKVISKIHAAMDEDRLTDEVAARMIGIAPRQLDGILRGDLDRFSVEELTSMHRNLNEIRAATRSFEEEIRKAKEKVAEVNPVIRRLQKTRKGDRVVGKLLEEWIDGDGATATRNHAAIQVPEGVGVFRYTIEVGEELNEETEPNVFTKFVPFKKCEPSLKAGLLKCIDGLVAEMTGNVKARRQPRARISA